VGLPASSRCAASPDGRTLLVSNDGQWMQSLQVVDTASGSVVQTIPYATPEALWVGVAATAVEDAAGRDADG
jgi:hypothetical protein